jgi:aryl-alcohol dehydrogenase-like predicted oxidoreductase
MTNLRRLPKTDIYLSPITYGAFAIGGWFWGGADQAEAIQALEIAISNGITAIDTAPVYGMGQSETLVGEAIRGKRTEVQLLTKFGMRWDTDQGDFTFDTKDNDGNAVKVYKFSGKQSVIEECERSLKRLNTDYIDLYQMHWPESVTPVEETMEALEILKQQGKIRAAGLCNASVEYLAQANDLTPISTNQVAYSMVNREIVKTLLPYCEKNDVGILPHTSLQKGLLTGKIKPGHQFGEGDHRPNNIFFQEHNHAQIMKILKLIEPIAIDRSISLSQLVINWTMQQPGITSVLVGARNEAQVLDNLKATTFLLNDDEIAMINSALKVIDLKL